MYKIKAENQIKFVSNIQELMQVVVALKLNKVKYSVTKKASTGNERNFNRELVQKFERMKNPNQITLGEYGKTMRLFDYKCAYCGTSLWDERLERDHILALSKLGLNRADNVVPACRSCNASKSAKHYYEWYKTQEFFDRKKLAKIETFLILKQHPKPTKESYQKFAKLVKNK